MPNRSQKRRRRDFSCLNGTGTGGLFAYSATFQFRRSSWSVKSISRSSRATASDMDTLSPSQRSQVMGRVRSKDTRPELAVRSLLHGMGYRFRLHSTELPGKPDIVLPRHQVAIFVHGCFWHRHPGCRANRTPKSRLAFWRAKFSANVKRDRAARQALRRHGWRVLVVWECELADPDHLRGKLARFIKECR